MATPMRTLSLEKMANPMRKNEIKADRANCGLINSKAKKLRLTYAMGPSILRRMFNPAMGNHKYV